MSNAIVLHVNYVEQGQSIPEMCRLAARWGYDGIEFRRTHKNYPDDQAYVDAIAKAREAEGLSVVLFGGPAPDFMAADPDARARGLDAAIAFYRTAAKALPLTVCNTFTGPLHGPDYFAFERNGSAMAAPEQWDWAVAGFKTLGEAAGELGFRFAFETHNCYIHDLAKPSRELVDRIGMPSVGLNLDYGNIALHPKGEPLEEALSLCGDKLYEVHLKNFFLPASDPRGFIACGLGDGRINHRAYLKALKQMGYAGPITLEAPREGDRAHFAVQDMKYLRGLMES